VSLPRVFISYSRDSNEHKAWVRQFAERLRADGVDVILDQWDLGLGADVTEFMERSLSSCDRVLVICTERYVQKANTLKDGVG
jgi:TIR domain